jgi:DNA-binding PadR family transcriptional regulator
MAVLIGIMCSVWMTSPLTANAFDLNRFVGVYDRGSTKVKTCVDEKGGRASFSNSKEPGVELRIALSNGNGLDGDDPFVASFYYNDVPETQLFSGVWSKIDERKNGRETYQLTPSGDLAASPTSDGWKELLDLINEQAGDACLTAPPATVYEALSDLVKATLVVEDKEPKCDPDDIDCLGACGGGSCRKAKVLLDVKAFMNDGDTDTAAEVKTDWVRFRYKVMLGYVVGSNPP